ncbi:MAG TPA: nuclear transport factor 2 family protein [Candidatus Binataceae bacterium]|nr:nuclear transport factor 2 family protein [Candidatus Binataceae bacterium]
MSSQDLEERIQRIEDIEAIRKLKARYCAFCDNGYDAHGLAALFTEDAVWDGGAFGYFEGRKAIHDFFAGISKRLSFAMHYVMNPLIDVEGDHATGRWYLFEPCTFDGSEPVWGAAYYDDRYIKVGGVWKFQSVKITSSFWTPYEQGWVKKRSVAE